MKEKLHKMIPHSRNVQLGGSAEGVNSSQDQKVLGINWNVERDEMYFDFEKLVKFARSLNPTQRNLPKMIASLYHPLGIISPVIITMKCLFQEVCALKELDWDTPLPANFAQTWEKWVNKLENTDQIVFARCYFAGFEMNESARSPGLYGFSDSSKKAYRAVVYLVSERYNCFVPKLLTPKTKVASLKPLSIPWLELQAAVILARLMTSVKEALNPLTRSVEMKQCMFGDNTKVLYWMKQLKECKPFVNNRKTEILKLTSAEQWFYCKTKLNPADLGTKGQSASELKVIKLWRRGPEFLRSAPENWPEFVSKVMVTPDEEVLREIKGYKTAVKTLAVMQVNVQNLDINLKGIIDANKYRDLGKLLRVTSYCLRFLHN